MFNSRFLEDADERIIMMMRRVYFPISRFAIFLIFFWFGALKVIDASPASPLVLALLQQTMPTVSPHTFMIGFGLFEMIIGMLFLLPKLERLAIAILMLHLITTAMPLFILKPLVWQKAFVPTLEGQYIIKNILILALAMGIAAHLRIKR